MVCRRCLKVIKQELEQIDVEVISLELGKLTVRSIKNIDKEIDDKVIRVLHLGVAHPHEEKDIRIFGIYVTSRL